MAAVIPEKVHFEPGSEALKVSAELSREPSLITASSLKVVNMHADIEQIQPLWSSNCDIVCGSN